MHHTKELTKQLVRNIFSGLPIAVSMVLSRPERVAKIYPEIPHENLDHDVQEVTEEWTRRVVLSMIPTDAVDEWLKEHDFAPDEIKIDMLEVWKTHIQKIIDELKED